MKCGLNILFHGLLCLVLAEFSNATLFEFLFRKPTDKVAGSRLTSVPNIPYELHEKDELFLQEARKLIGRSLSELDLCQHRVIMKLTRSCSGLNAEDIGKLSVMLFNCQSYAEGRKTYECTDNMTLEQCTSQMDPETWNGYHLITNRAKALCMVLRHDQFRSMSEITINKLVSAARNQVLVMEELDEAQRTFREATMKSLDYVLESNQKLSSVHEDTMKQSEMNRNRIVANLEGLNREKGLIKESTYLVASLLSRLQEEIGQAINKTHIQAKDSEKQHFDMAEGFKKIELITNRIADQLLAAAEQIVEQNNVSGEQYNDTLAQLKEINRTISNLARLLKNFQTEFDEKLNWISETVGGRDYLMTRMYVICTHVTCMLVGMLCLAFVNACNWIRIVFVIALPVNFLATICDWHGLDMLTLTAALFSLYIGNLIYGIIKMFQSKMISDVERAIVLEPAKLESSERLGSIERELDDGDNDNDQYAHKMTKRNGPTNSDHRDTLRTTLIKSRTFMSNFDDSLRELTATPFEKSLINRTRCASNTARNEQCRNAAVKSGGLYCRIHERLVKNGN